MSLGEDVVVDVEGRGVDGKEDIVRVKSDVTMCRRELTAFLQHFCIVSRGCRMLVLHTYVMRWSYLPTYIMWWSS
jgi:hypothetical protein